ncbi:MAG: hypothetical protein V2I35_05120 [Desulfocapsaceae bacterium]|jgi:hypothetical protein|nr:hypothetical protein [Desulfocapsaceae bacterium]
MKSHTQKKESLLDRVTGYKDEKKSIPHFFPQANSISGRITSPATTAVVLLGFFSDIERTTLSSNA